MVALAERFPGTGHRPPLRPLRTSRSRCGTVDQALLSTKIAVSCPGWSFDGATSQSTPPCRFTAASGPAFRTGPPRTHRSTNWLADRDARDAGAALRVGDRERADRAVTLECHPCARTRVSPMHPGWTCAPPVTHAATLHRGIGVRSLHAHFARSLPRTISRNGNGLASLETSDRSELVSRWPASRKLASCVPRTCCAVEGALAASFAPQVLPQAHE